MKKTNVIFLIGKDENEVFAFFPDHKHDARGNYICYAQNEGHGPCALDYAKESTIAKPDQYKDLKSELEKVYEYNFNVLKSW